LAAELTKLVAGAALLWRGEGRLLEDDLLRGRGSDMRAIVVRSKGNFIGTVPETKGDSTVRGSDEQGDLLVKRVECQRSIARGREGHVTAPFLAGTVVEKNPSRLRTPRDSLALNYRVGKVATDTNAFDALAVDDDELRYPKGWKLASCTGSGRGGTAPDQHQEERGRQRDMEP